MDVIWIPMKNKFYSKCIICGKGIKTGTDIEWVKFTGIRHPECGRIYEESESLKRKSLELFLAGKNSTAKQFYKQASALLATLGIVNESSEFPDISTEEEVDELENVNIPKHEDLHCEFKSSWLYDYKVDVLKEKGQTEAAQERAKNPEKYAKLIQKDIMQTVCAFLNNDGGSIWIGISDERKLLGLEKDFEILSKGGKRSSDLLKQQVTGAVSKYLKKKYPREIEYFFHSTEKETHVFEIRVKPLDKSDEPAMFRVNNETIPYVRHDESDVPYSDHNDWLTYAKKRFSA